MNLQAFFMKKEPVEGIALFRILFGFVLVLNALLLIPGLNDFFSKSGMLESASPLRFDSLNLFYFFEPTETAIASIFAIHLIAAVSLMLGWFTRSSAAVAFVTLTSIHQENNLVLNSGDTALRVILFLLIFSRAGDWISVDRWIAKRRGWVSGAPRFQYVWAQRLIQLQVTFIYFSTVWCKLDGNAWANGDAVYYTSRLWEFKRFSVPLVFDHLWVMRGLTWSSLGIEFLLGTLIWVRPLRLPIIGLGILLHLGIEWTMNIPVFEILMIVLLIGMLDPKQAWYLIRRKRIPWH